MDRDLGRDDWLRAARLALLKGGASEVRVERLARDLRVTKGSFYWHFKDREELLELLLREWEDDFPEIIEQLKGLRGRKALLLLLRLVVEMGVFLSSHVGGRRDPDRSVVCSNHARR